MASKLISKIFFSYVIVGVAGFIVDGGILTILMNFGYGILESRLFSFSVAVSITWIFNRIWTFHSESNKKIKEYIGYFATQIAGALINLFIFYALIFSLPQLKSLPILPLAFGAAASLFFNFAISKLCIFRKP